MKNTADIKNPYLLSTLFSSAFMKRLIEGNHHQYISGVLQQTNFRSQVKETHSVQKILNKVFEFLTCNYRCEYVFKTAVLNEILLKRHDLINSRYLTEFRAANAKADILILNGTSSVYEIKSDIDNLDRLNNQVLAYQKIFDKTFVVSNKSSVTKIKGIIPQSVGILLLNQDMEIETIREAVSNLHNIDKQLMFDCLRKNEYLSIIEQAFGFIPNLPGTLIHAACKELFCTLKNRKAHTYFIEALKKRQLSEAQVSLVNNSSLALKCLLVEKKYSEKHCELIKFGLNNNFIPVKISDNVLSLHPR